MRISGTHFEIDNINIMFYFFFRIVMKMHRKRSTRVSTGQNGYNISCFLADDFHVARSGQMSSTPPCCETIFCVIFFGLLFSVSLRTTKPYSYKNDNDINSCNALFILFGRPRREERALRLLRFLSVIIFFGCPAKRKKQL